MNDTYICCSRESSNHIMSFYSILLTDAMYSALTSKPRFQANHRQVGLRQFGVFHYAGLVEYDTTGFLEKNKDELPREATDLLLSSSSKFVKELAAIISPPEKEPVVESASSRRRSSTTKKKSKTVGGHFATQLQSLRAKIDETAPHYVRCLKPNGQLVPDNFDPLMIVEQLRCAGVVEAVRVSRVGYPQRYTHSQFVQRYKILGAASGQELNKMAKKRGVKTVVALADIMAKEIMSIEKKKTCSNEEDVDSMAVGIQVGKTKVFLRQRAFDIIEKMRKEYTTTAAVKVQAIARGYICKRHYAECLEAIPHLQCFGRVVIAKQRLQAARDRRDRQLAMLEIAQWCQRRQRGVIGRARYNKLNQVRLDERKAKENGLSKEQRSLFRKRKEEMERKTNLAAKKEAVDAAAVKLKLAKKSVEPTESQEEVLRLKSELEVVQNELANVQKQLEEERNRPREQAVLNRTHSLSEEECSKEDDMVVRVKVDEAFDQGEDSMKRKMIHRGQCVIILVLLGAIAGVAGVLASSSGNGNIDGASYLRGGGIIGTSTTVPSTSTSPSAIPSTFPTFLPSSMPTNMPTKLPFCPNGTKEFELTLYIRDIIPTEMSWKIYDRCSGEQYLECDKCQAQNSQPNLPSQTVGCLPIWNNSTQEPREYVFEMVDEHKESDELVIPWVEEPVDETNDHWLLAANPDELSEKQQAKQLAMLEALLAQEMIDSTELQSFKYVMKYDDALAFEEMSVNGTKVSHFGEGVNSCSGAPSMSSVVSTS